MPHFKFKASDDQRCLGSVKRQTSLAWRCCPNTRTREAVARRFKLTGMRRQAYLEDLAMPPFTVGRLHPGAATAGRAQRFFVLLTRLGQPFMV
jgi:hypothetical protein